MAVRRVARWVILSLAVSLSSCATGGSGGSPDDHVLHVRSNYWTPVDIVLVGEGFRRQIGTVKRLESRTLVLPAHLVSSAPFVTLELRPHCCASASDNVVQSNPHMLDPFTLASGGGADLQIEHMLHMSKLEIRQP